MALESIGGMGGGGLASILSRFGSPGAPGAINGTPVVQSTANGGSPGFWQQFAQQFGGASPQTQSARPPAAGGGQSSNPYTDKLSQMGVPGVDLITAYLDNLENRTGRLSELVRGPTMPFLPKLYTGPVGPNPNPGQMGLAQLLTQIATRGR